MDAFSKLLTFLRDMSLGILFFVAGVAWLLVSPITITYRYAKWRLSKKKGECNGSLYGR